MSLSKIQAISKNNHYEFIHVESAVSTMLNAREYLNINNENCIIISDVQTKGRGRRGNFWHSPAGNIYCSITFSDLLSIKDHFLYNILIATSIKEALEKFNAKNIKFKWPNDIFYKESKFCGMISEIFQNNNLESYMIIGFGINVDSSPKLEDYSLTHLKSFCDVQGSHEFLLVFFTIFFNNLKKLVNNQFEKLIIDFKESLMFKNEYINILLPDNTLVSGIFKDINSDGSLILNDKNQIKNIYNGSIKI